MKILALIDGPVSPEELELFRKRYAEMNGLPLDQVKATDFGGAATITPVGVNPRIENVTINTSAVEDNKSLFGKIVSAFRRRI